MKHLLLVAIACMALNAVGQPNAKPFVIPQLNQWVAGDGEFVITESSSIAVATSELMATAEQFSKDCELMFGFSLPITKNAKQSDILFQLGTIATDNNEGYAIKTTKNRTTITANTPTGAYWATRTMLQIMEQSDGELALPCGSILDFPQYPVRGFVLDCGRKFFTMDFLEKYVRFLSYYKVNTFQIHLNDNAFKQFYDNDWAKTPSAFRLQCDTYPGLTAFDGSYTKLGFVNLQKLAEELHVMIIPEIDIPAHSLAFSKYMPEIGSTEYGADHLDLFNPKTYQFLDGLFKEYLEGQEPVFRGPIVHIGTDEYSNKKQDVVEKFRYFTSYYIEQIEKYGKQAMVWGALTHARGTTPVKSDSVLMNCWYNGYAEPDSMINLGYDVLSVPDGLLYIVPMAGYYHDYLDIEKIYNTWTPLNIGGKMFEKGNEKIKGGMFALWNDHADNGVSAADAHHRVWPAMQTVSQKLWSGDRPAVDFDEFNRLRKKLSEAPAVNILGRAARGVVISAPELSPYGFLPVQQVGYGYRVDFVASASDSLDRGAILTKNDDATFYLSDPENGRLGFSRDGYLFTFDFAIPINQRVKIGIEGDSRSTRLFVNDKLQENLEITYQTFAHQDQTSRRALIKTLQFPLAEVGALKSINITDFIVRYTGESEDK